MKPVVKEGRRSGYSARGRRALTLCALAGLFFASGMDGTNCGGPPGSNGNNNGNNNSNSNGSGGPQLLSSDHTLGDVNAPVKVFEYSDLECPFCGAFARNQFQTLKTDYIDTGDVLFVYRHFPLTNIHADAQGAAEASECAADQDMFWEFIELVFENQPDESAATLRDHAEALGLDLAAYDACIAAGKEQRVQQDVTSGTALGVDATPTFFVNGTKTSATNLFDVIDEKLGG